MSAEPVSPSDRPDDENLFAIVAGRARRATDGQLVAAAAIGVAGAAAIGLLLPRWWIVALPLLCIGSFGVWGIADRSAAERAKAGGGGSGRIALAGLRVAAAVVGTAAGVLTLLVIVARMVGTWRS